MCAACMNCSLRWLPIRPLSNPISTGPCIWRTRVFIVITEKGYYNRLISGNINQTVLVDSMQCDFDNYPYRITTFARQMIIRNSNITERSLVTRCFLQSTVRSDNNPQGFMAERFEILENRDIRTVER